MHSAKREDDQQVGDADGADARAGCSSSFPTYNERENLPVIAERLRKAVPDAHLLSPTTTAPTAPAKIADELAADDDHVHVLHRPGKQGLGAAYIAGFRWGLDEDYDVLVEMDADGSHQPEELHKLLDALADGRRPGDRFPVGARRQGRQLAQLAGVPVTGRQRLHPDDARRPGPRRHRRVPRLPRHHAGEDRPGRRGVAGLLLPGRPDPAHGPAAGCASPRCPSRSWSGRPAPAR